MQFYVCEAPDPTGPGFDPPLRKGGFDQRPEFTVREVVDMTGSVTEPPEIFQTEDVRDPEQWLIGHRDHVSARGRFPQSSESHFIFADVLQDFQTEYEVERFCGMIVGQ
jgi:hypothetical protein